MYNTWHLVFFVLIGGSFGRLRSRDPGEHVILADCADQLGVKSSQMAYFRGMPGPTPEAVAVVLTPYGQTRHWEAGVTSAVFKDGNTFTANINPSPVVQGGYAGPGKNDYGLFACWANRWEKLYSMEGVTCTGIYDCNKALPPGKHPPACLLISGADGEISVIVSSSLPDPTPSSSTNSSETEKSEGLGKPEIVALAVSLPLGIGSLAIAYLAWRYPVREIAKKFHIHDHRDPVTGILPPGEEMQALDEDENKAESIIVDSSEAREVT